LIPVHHLCEILGTVCIPLAGRRVTDLRKHDIQDVDLNELTIEMELCIGLIFKPLRHHLQTIAEGGQDLLLSIWSPILDVLKSILDNPDPEKPSSDHDMLKTTNELTIEHLRNVIMVLIGFGVLQADSSDEISTLTWTSISDIECCKSSIEEWKQAA